MSDISFKQVFKESTNTLKGDTFEYLSTQRPEVERWLVTTT